MATDHHDDQCGDGAVETAARVFSYSLPGGRFPIVDGIDDTDVDGCRLLLAGCAALAVTTITVTNIVTNTTDAVDDLVASAFADLCERTKKNIWYKLTISYCDCGS